MNKKKSAPWLQALHAVMPTLYKLYTSRISLRSIVAKSWI